MANQLAEIIVELLTSGAFDDLSEEKHFQELSQSRLGYSADVSLAQFLIDELRTRGLARPSEDGVSIPLHPTVRTTILVILGQLSRVAGGARGLAIHPTTNDVRAIHDLMETLCRNPLPSRDNVVAFDLEPVCLKLDSVPLDDILQFRAENHGAYKAYMRNLRRFMIELVGINVPEERNALLLERRQEIADSAHEMRRSASRAFHKENVASWSFGLVGSAWSLGTGDVIGAALAAARLILPGILGGPDTVTAYSYLFHVQHSFGK